MSLFFKIICIILISALGLGIVSAVFDIQLPELPSIDDNNTTVKPIDPVDPVDPEEPETPVAFVLTNWHTEDHETSCKKVFACNKCNEVYTVDNVTALFPIETYYYGWGSAAYYMCSVCSDGVVGLFTSHCLVDGECHDCDFVCNHLSVDDYVEEQSVHTLPDGHPIREYCANNFYPYDHGEYYDIDSDSVCDLCGMTIEVEEPQEPEEPVTFDLTNWHTENHENRCLDYTTCSLCGTTYYLDTIGTLSATDLETWSWGFSNCYACPCGNLVAIGNIHCYVNGICHDCGASCLHGEANDFDEIYLESNYCGLPENHPMRVNGISLYVVGGICQLCGMSEDSSSEDDTSSGGSDYVTLNAWCGNPSKHTSHDYANFYCSACDKFYTTLDDCIPNGVEGCNIGSTYLDISCSHCGSPISEGFAMGLCCYIDGVCHIGEPHSQCTHECHPYDKYYVGYIPNHPLNEPSTFPFEPGESYVVNGTCMLCLATVSES